MPQATEENGQGLQLVFSGDGLDGAGLATNRLIYSCIACYTTRIILIYPAGNPHVVVGRSACSLRERHRPTASSILVSLRNKCPSSTLAAMPRVVVSPAREMESFSSILLAPSAMWIETWIRPGRASSSIGKTWRIPAETADTGSAEPAFDQDFGRNLEGSHFTVTMLPSAPAGRRPSPRSPPTSTPRTAPTRRISTPRAAPPTKPPSSISSSSAASGRTISPTARTYATRPPASASRKASASARGPSSAN
jgi:hypothetical protein